MNDKERATVGRLINLVRVGKLETVVGSLNMLTYTGPRQRERLGHILAILIEATATMVRGKAEARRVSGTFGADLRRPDESTVDIDSLPPPVRATIRALLAQVNQHPQDAADQVSLAVAGDQRSTVDVVLLALRWAVDAVESCEHDGTPMPAWLVAS